MAVFQDFQQVTALLCVQFDQPQSSRMRTWVNRQGVDEFGIASVPFGDVMSWRSRGRRRYRAVSARQAVARAQASQVLPTPVGPVMRILRCSLTHWQDASDCIRDLSSPRGWR